MKCNGLRSAFVVAAVTAALALSGCGSSGTISSLTDSDSTASMPVAAVDTAVQSTAASVAETVVSSVPEIVPQTVAGTEVSPAAGSDAAAGEIVASDDSAVTVSLTGEGGTASNGTAAPAQTSADGEISLLQDSAAAVTETPTPTPSPEETPAETSAEEGGPGYVTGDEVNLREEPSTGSDDNVIDTLYEGDELTILESEDGWYKVSVNGREGWVNASFIQSGEYSGSDDSEDYDESEEYDESEDYDEEENSEDE